MNMMPYLMLAIFWTLWCALHSGMIARGVTLILKRKLGDLYRFYRIFYNAVSVLTLIPVLAFSHSLRSVPFFTWSGVWRPVQVLLVLAALTLFWAGGRHYDLGQFMGFRQVVEHRSGKGLTESGGVDTSGILGVMRHPWYTAGILGVWARPVDPAVLVTNLVLTSYLIIGTFLEERKLVAEFGDEYREYQERVPMFLPGGRKGSRQQQR